MKPAEQALPERPSSTQAGLREDLARAFKSGNLRAALAAGMDAHMAKPLDIDVLTAALTKPFRRERRD